MKKRIKLYLWEFATLKHLNLISPVLRLLRVEIPRF